MYERVEFGSALLDLGGLLFCWFDESSETVKSCRTQRLMVYSLVTIQQK